MRPTATIPSAMLARIAPLRSFSSATRWYSSALATEADEAAARATRAWTSSSRQARGAVE